MSRTRQILVLIVALAVLLMLWLTGNEPQPYGALPDPEPAVSAATATPASMPQAPDVPRGIPRDGTLDPISIDPRRPADELPQYQADAILTDYRDKPKAADTRYLGQYFIVEGVASGIRRDAEHRVFIDIRTNDPGQPVRGLLLQRQICGPGTRECEVEARATMVRRGQKVAVECHGAGLDSGTPMLTDCLLRGGAN